MAGKIAKSHHQADDPVMKYVINNSLREPEVLRKLREATFKNTQRSFMLVAPEEAQLFRVILPLLNPQKCIEIGVFTGYNTINMAMCLPSGGKVVACDVTDESLKAVDFTSLVKEAGVEDKVDLRIQPAIKTLDELIVNGESGTYDFVFIDADKPSQMIYYEKSLVLLRQGGMVAIDNVIYHGKVTKDPLEMDEGTKCIHELNMKIHKDERVTMAMLPFADGVTLATKN
ncbi:probable caffeoyl-CoA O-methyltransferase 1 [Nematostella vectensis]|uniref:probable caffeoyl-CoA O-methyltransferase 1 n=1 Tax=Nematostella vectensis TaxID=45351 RepID=UPI002076E4B5|nr:probable caffeoyl-CoA O-methyltransferase 1 [Nematostella vectensis]